MGTILLVNRKLLKKDIRRRYNEQNVGVFEVDRYERSDQNVEGQMMDVQAIHITGLLPEKEVLVEGIDCVFAQIYFLIHK